MAAAVRRLAFAIMACAASPAPAQGELSVLCNVPLAWCEAAASAFQREASVRVKLTQKSPGESLAQISAEAGDPRHDLWYAGGADLHLQAAGMGLTEPYRSSLLPAVREWAVRLAEVSEHRTVGIFAGVVAIAYNTEVLARKGLPEPKCWADLGRPEYRGQLQMGSPGAPDIAYAAIATLVQIFEEGKAFELLKSMHRNVAAYPRGETGAIRAAARGETAIAVTFVHDALAEIASGFPIRLVAPCEGTGYEVAAMSIVKGARNLENAKRFYDWALTPAAQRIGADTRHFEVPSNPATPVVRDAPELAGSRSIEPDYARFGSVAERRRLLDKWEREVRSSPQS